MEFPHSKLWNLPIINKQVEFGSIQKQISQIDNINNHVLLENIKEDINCNSVGILEQLQKNNDIPSSCESEIFKLTNPREVNRAEDLNFRENLEFHWEEHKEHNKIEVKWSNKNKDKSELGVLPCTPPFVPR